MMSTSDDRHEALQASNELWLKRLTASPADLAQGPASEEEREADLLRAAILRASRATSMSDEVYRARRGARDEMLRDQLLLAAQREGLLARRKTFNWRWPAGIGVAAALLLGIALVGYQHNQPLYPVEPVLRGNPADVQTLLSENPRSRAESLSAALTAAGAQVQIYQRGSVYTLDIVVLPENADAVTTALKAQGLDVANGDRSLRVQIKKP
jgi:hypothetical protein